MTIDKINKTRFHHKWWNKNKKLNYRTRWLEYAKESKEIVSRDLKEFENGK